MKRRLFYLMLVALMQLPDLQTRGNLFERHTNLEYTVQALPYLALCYLVGVVVVLLYAWLEAWLHKKGVL